MPANYTFSNYVSEGNSGEVTQWSQFVTQWGSQMLVPTLLQGSAAQNNALRNFGSGSALIGDELKGVGAFINYLNTNGISITSPLDIWKYATFITYIADSRDLSAIQFGNSPFTSTSNSLQTNILQSATYTITAFSGECSAFARLYNATISVLGYDTYIAFILPKNNAGGHATPIFYYNGTWYDMNYYNLYSGSDPIQLVAYLWSHDYQFGWSDYVVVIAKNVWFNPSTNANVNTYTNPIAVYDIGDMVQNGAISTNPSINKTNYSLSFQWNGVQNTADKLFQIEAYKSTLTQYFVIGGAIAGTLLGLPALIHWLSGKS